MRFIVICSLLLMSVCALAGVTELPNLPNIDKRMRVQSSAASVQAQSVGVGIRDRLPGVSDNNDELTGAPSWVGHRDRFLTGKNGRGGVLGQRIPASDRKDAVVRTFFDEYRSLYGHGSEVLKDDDLIMDSVDSDGLHSFVWWQKLDGIPIFDSQVRAHVTKDGELVSVFGSMIPSADTAANSGTPNRAALKAKPTISAVQAVFLAAQSIGESADLAELKSADADQNSPSIIHFTAPFLEGEATVEMTWLPMKRNSLNLAWHVELTSATSGTSFMVVIDARNGDVLVRYMRTISSLNTQPVTYRVFTGESPRPMSPGWSIPSTSQPLEVARSLPTLISMNVADLKGWVIDYDSSTGGNNVRCFYPSYPYSNFVVCLACSPYRVFDQPLDTSQDPKLYENAAIIQAFYTCNLLHDKLYDLGWTESTGNCQQDNFGKGGKDKDSVGVYVQSCRNNALCNPKPDGQCPKLELGIFDGNRDSALDAEVVTHEYIHILSSRLAGGNGAWPTAQQTQAMGEGWSDFFAISMFSQPDIDNLNGNYGGCYANGAYSTGDYYYGFRRYPYSTDITKNPLTFKDMWTPLNHPGVPDNPAYSWNTDPFEVHNGGEIWCTTLWDARNNIIKYSGSTGNDVMMKLVVKGLMVGPYNNPTVLQSRDAILSADTLLYGGGFHRELWEAFAKRGMGYSAKWGTEAFDMPPLGSTCDYPSFSLPGGCYTYNPTIAITCSTLGATIRYTTDGTIPTSSSTLYTVPVTISTDRVLRAKAFKTGLADSGFRSNFYKITSVTATPTFTPPGGAFTSPSLVSIDCATQGATIRYTTNGLDPTDVSTAYAGPITVDKTMTIKAKAWTTGLVASSTASAYFSVGAPIYVDQRATGTPHNGTSWNKAYLKIQDAINAINQGELWVATGVYSERITLKDNVSLYGGFAGDETRREQRNPASYVTTIDGGKLGITVFAPLGVLSGTTVDGFIIRNGKAYSAGGVYCYSSSPNITNNIIESNESTYGGGGVCGYLAAPKLTGNTIRNNIAQYGGGVYFQDGQPVLSSNLIYGNSASYNGGGVYCFASTSSSLTAKIVSNTIYGNTAVTNGGGGVYCDTNASPSISNNIIAYNSSGIAKVTSSAPVLTANDVYGNSFSNYNYIGLSAGASDISLEPQFADRVGGDLHIRRTSPCIDKGSNSAAGLPTLDIDGQPRTNNSIVDIGADESYGESYSIIYRVKGDSPTNGPGNYWSNAYHRLIYAMDVALPGDEIWVAQGTYSGTVTVPGSVALYGGFAGTEIDRDRRCWRDNISTLDGAAAGSVLTIAAGADSSTIIDGFTIKNGSSLSGGGIYCSANSSPMIRNNIITANIGVEGGGGGVYCINSTPTIVNNVIYGNTTPNPGGGVFCDHSAAVIRYNTIYANTSDKGWGGGIACVYSPAELTGNVIVNNRGYGIYCDHSEPAIAYNDVYKNRDVDYYGIADQTERNGNIKRDPLFVNVSTGDFHLRTGSLCVDAAGSDYAPEIDRDGYIRPQDGNSDWVVMADMGAYEYPADFAKIRWNCPDGNSTAFSGMVVSAIIPDLGMIYVEKPDRSYGMGILTWGDVSEGDIVNVIGKIATDTTTGERFIGTESTVSRVGGTVALKPLGMALRSLGGGTHGLQIGLYGKSGLNNIGLLVKVWGKVTSVESETHPSWFTIDDGSGEVRIEAPETVTIDPVVLAGQHPYVSVIGISSCRKPGSQVLPLVRMRKLSDLKILKLPPF